ncbi:endonuclease domain-containing protein [Mycetocola sp.]|uniref:endonuclease domain-containing protein n=1 Tax=Mycetocola sp. TaxID=1871042 RepID=UPI003988C1BD
MRVPAELPPDLGDVFSVRKAVESGVGEGRLRGADLESPFHGVRRMRAEAPEQTPDSARAHALGLAGAYAQRMSSEEFFSHETAALIWGAPLPASAFGDPHVSVRAPGRTPRARGVVGHTVRPEMVRIGTRNGMRVASPASTWAMLGGLELYDLVAVGDFFVRVHRSEGYFRVNPGKPPLATQGQLRSALDAGRRRGAANLRAALPRIRVDSWSRTETWTRLILGDAGLPEPVLNADYYDDFGMFLACLDLSYPEFKVAIEYEGGHHRDGKQFARDIDRLNRLVEQGWRVVQVSARLVFRDPLELARRVQLALLERGWKP